MANATVSRLGAINGDATPESDARALFEKLFTGEVMVAFEQTTVAKDKVRTRTLDHGKSASFAAVGHVTASYHTPGAELTGQTVLHNERVISIDGLLVSDVFVAQIDELMNHYDVRGPYSNEMGRKLAYQFDQDAFCELILAARNTAILTGGNDGTIVTDANLGSATEATKANALASALYSAAQAMDEKDVPGERYAAFKPAEYNCLVKGVQSNGFSAIAKEYGGEGSYAEGNIIKVAGISILKSNRVPTTDLSSKTYHGVNASTTKGIVWTQDAIGVVQLLGVSTEMQWDIRRQGTLLVAKMAIGMGTLRPECAVELRTGTPT